MYELQKSMRVAHAATRTTFHFSYAISVSDVSLVSNSNSADEDRTCSPVHKSKGAPLIILETDLSYVKECIKFKFLGNFILQTHPQHSTALSFHRLGHAEAVPWRQTSLMR